MEAERTTPPGDEMTIEELATASQLTVRNIRAYQSRGILTPPRMQGRKGFYGLDHLQRLKHVAELQRRGYSLAAIQDILAGIDPSMSAVLRAWKDQNPMILSQREFEESFPFFHENQSLLQRMMDAGHVEIRDEKVVVTWPAIFEVANTLHNMGAVLEPLVSLMGRTQCALQEVARDVLHTFINDVLHKREDTDDPEVVARIVTDLRPQVLAAMRSLFSHAIESNITTLLQQTREKE